MSYFDSLFSGIKWTSISSVVVSLLAILKIAVLTSFLAKSDFGHFALVMSILSFINLFSDFGLPIAILHIKTITPKAFSSLYWLGILSGLLIYLILYWLTPYIADYFQAPLLEQLLPIAGLAVLINSIGNLYRVLALKKLKYSRIAGINILESIVVFTSACLLAMAGWGVWSLIHAYLLGKVILELFFFVYGYRQLPLSFVFSRQAMNPFFKIGKYSVGGQLINYFNREIDILLIARLGGDAATLGVYSLARQLVLKVGGLVNNVISEAARPILPKFQDKLEKLKINFLKIIQTISTLNSLLYILFIIFTPQIVAVLYGEDYNNLIPVARILAIFAYLRSIIRYNGNLIVATGKTELSLFMNAFTLPLIASAVWIGFSGGLSGIAWGQVVAMTLLLFISWYFLIYRLLRVYLSTYLFALLPSWALIREVLTRIMKKYEKKVDQPDR
ncbi:MOP flippase family protein [Flavilitoribacter nigricans]|uniref:MOP flippase family protein n=1 Tax=Flavilitoribacter nigricans TaxID=70997 RepID=UPI00147669E3|nr:MOP flippase family protein [Flavilitoribacter nigricans]